MRGGLPNFSSLRALVLLRKDANCDALRTQLERLRLVVEVQWPPAPGIGSRCDVVFFDVDHGYDGMFGWPTGAPQVPLIAIIGSETPGRLEWARSQKPSSHLLKPIGSNGVFHALFTALANHEEAIQLQGKIAELRLRLKCRPIVFAAILKLMESRQLGDDEAFKMLRTISMQNHISIEEMSQKILSGLVPLTPNSARSTTPRPRDGPDIADQIK